jgi:hypothetical protein
LGSVGTSQTSVGNVCERSDNGGFSRWKHVVLHYFRLEGDHRYPETPNRLEYMTEICDALSLDPDNLPDFTMIYKSFDQLEMWV